MWNFELSKPMPCRLTIQVLTNITVSSRNSAEIFLNTMLSSFTSLRDFLTYKIILTSWKVKIIIIITKYDYTICYSVRPSIFVVEIWRRSWERSFAGQQCNRQGVTWRTSPLLLPRNGWLHPAVAEMKTSYNLIEFSVRVV